MDETQNSNLLADVGRWRRRTEWIATITILGGSISGRAMPWLGMSGIPL